MWDGGSNSLFYRGYQLSQHPLLRDYFPLLYFQCTCGTCDIKFIPTYFILFDIIANEMFLFSMLNYLLSVYKNHWFHILILHFVTLMNPLIGVINYLRYLVVFHEENHVICKLDAYHLFLFDNYLPQKLWYHV
jgi:hypothetical protein